MNFSHIVAYSFILDKKGQIDKTDALITPGPTKYEPKPLAVMSSDPAWTISKEKRLKKNEMNFPEPGKYESKTFIGEGPKYTIGEKREDPFDLTVNNKKRKKKKKKSYKTPGPGTYNPLDMYQAPRYTIRLKGKEFKAKGIYPDVRKYELRKDEAFIAPCHKFNHDKRFNDQLGPLDVPGPQHYQIIGDTFGTNGPRYTFSKSLRSGKSRPATAFNPDRDFDNESGTKKNENRPETPGPGSYKFQEFMGNGCKMSFYKDKSTFGETSSTPGPGYYNLDLSNRPCYPSYRIPSSTRPSTAISSQLKTPGPDKYDPQGLIISQRIKGPEWRIGKSLRDPLHNTANTPGPGQYFIANDCMPAGPKYTMSARYKEIKLEKKPDPGKYEQVDVHRYKEPHWVIGKEEREDTLKSSKKANIPGPGAYCYKDSATVHPISFIQDKKFKKNMNFVPGPGQYRIPCSFDDVNDYTRAKGNFDPTFRYV